MKPLFTSVIIVLLTTVLLTSCGELTPAPKQPENLLEFSKSPSWELSSLNGYSVDEFTLIVFKQGISAEKWKAIFDQTKELSHLRKTQKELTRRIHNGEDLETERDAVTLQITDILTEISDDHAAYMLNWGTNEKCEFKYSDELVLVCRKPPKDAPQFVSPWTQAKPNPRKDLWVFPWLEIRMESQTKEWSMKLKLKPESKTENNEWIWSGEIEATGVFSSSHHPYGYIELRLIQK